MKFKIGDRVSFYNAVGRSNGSVTDFHRNPELVKVLLDRLRSPIICHVKQLRKLKPKVKKEPSVASDVQFQWVASNGSLNSSVRAFHQLWTLQYRKLVEGEWSEWTDVILYSK